MARKKNQAITDELLKEESVSSTGSGGKKATSKSSTSSSSTAGAASGGAIEQAAVDSAPSSTAVDSASANKTDPVQVETVGVSQEAYAADGAALYDAGLDGSTAQASTQESAQDTAQDTAQSNAAVEPEVEASVGATLEDAESSTTDSTASSTANGSSDTAGGSASASDVLDAPVVAEKPSINVSSKDDAENALSDYNYSESEAVLDAYAALKEYMESAPDEYTSSYQEQIDALLEQILNREDFSYDFNADPLYQQYKNQYEHSAMLAMQDTMAQAQSATGGYGSSYAVQAASGAYQNELNELTGVMPELYELAYNIYSDKGDGMLDNLSALTEQEELAQSLYQDIVDNYYTGLEASTEAAENAYNKDYGQYQDSLSYLQELLDYYAGQEQQAFENEQAKLEYELALKEYQESIRQWEAELAIQQSQWQAEFDAAQAAKAASSTSSASSSSSKSTFTMSDEAKDLKTTITQEMRVYAAEGAKAADINEAAAEILASYYSTGVITKEEANAIGVSYDASF